MSFWVVTGEIELGYINLHLLTRGGGVELHRMPVTAVVFISEQAVFLIFGQVAHRIAFAFDSVLIFFAEHRYLFCHGYVARNRFRGIAYARGCNHGLAGAHAGNRAIEIDSGNSGVGGRPYHAPDIAGIIEPDLNLTSLTGEYLGIGSPWR